MTFLRARFVNIFFQRSTFVGSAWSFFKHMVCYRVMWHKCPGVHNVQYNLVHFTRLDDCQVILFVYQGGDSISCLIITFLPGLILISTSYVGFLSLCYQCFSPCDTFTQPKNRRLCGGIDIHMHSLVSFKSSVFSLVFYA